MAAFPLPICLSTIVFLFIRFKILAADPNSYFSFQGNFKGSNFESNIALCGDAKAVENGSLVQLTQPVGSSAGRVIYKKPIRLTEGKSKSSPESLASFSTYFTFSMSLDKGDGLAFFMVPSGFNVNAFANSSFGFSLESEKSNSRIVAVEFDTMKDAKYGNLDENHVAIDVGGFISVRSRNVSVGNVEFNSGKRLHSWIDYEASYKRLEVRLSESGDRKPVDPLLSYPIDLSKIWDDEALSVGLSSSSGNSSKSCILYSWTFKLRIFPHWSHSQPIDPEAVVKDAKPVVLSEKSDCVLRVLAALVFGTACGVVGASMVLYLRTIFGNRRPVVRVAPEACVDFDYEKVKVVVDKAVEEDCKQ